MATEKAEPGRPAVQPPDEELDFSDLPEVTDFSKAVRGKFSPRRLALEAEVRRLRAELDECTRSHQRMNADYERAVGLLEEAERDFGADVLAKITAFLHAS